MPEPTNEVHMSTVHLIGLAYALRDALAEMAEELACRENGAHHCANCARSLHRAKVITAESRAKIASVLEVILA